MKKTQEGRFQPPSRQDQPSALRAAVFFDRDGTLAFDVPYCSRVEDFRFYPETMPALRQLSDTNLLIIVATNQSGIARGYLSEGTLGQIHTYMTEAVSRAGGRIDGVCYCPHHADDECSCRKPRAGLLLDASVEYGIDLTRSFLVGDKETDVEAAHAAGCRAVLLTREGAPTETMADAHAVDLTGAVDWILREVNDAVPS